MKVNKQMLYQLKADRAEALNAANTALAEDRMEDYAAHIKTVEALNPQIGRVEKLLEEQDRFSDPEQPPPPAWSRSRRRRATMRR